MRARGWGYYAMSIFWPGAGVANMAATIMREAWEDYEYLFHANGDKHPDACKSNSLDLAVHTLGFCVQSWSKDEGLAKALRTELGKYIDGQRATVPYYNVTIDNFLIISVIF